MALSEPITERRRRTRSGVYQYLYRQKNFCSRQTIAQDIGLSLPTVYQNLSELMEAGLVGYSGIQRSTGGRRAMGLSVVADARVAVGIYVTDSRIRFAAADLLLQELCYHSMPRFSAPDLASFAALLAEALEQFIDENKIDRSKILGVGIAQPGILNADRSVLISAPTLRVKNVPLGPLYDAIPYPVLVQNDADCGGHAEWFLRYMEESGPRSSAIAYLSLEDGVGGSLFLNEEFYHGNHRRSAEFGHMPVENGGLLCACGKQGCLEAYCSSRRCSTDMGMTLPEFFQELEQGNKDCADRWDDILRHLSIAINSINMTLDCDVILGGTMSHYLEPWFSTLRTCVGEGNPFDPEGSFLQLSVLKSHSVPLGAALHYLRQFTDSI